MNSWNDVNYLDGELHEEIKPMSCIEFYTEASQNMPDFGG